MGKIYRNDILYSGSTNKATNINYENEKIESKNVQGAIDEIVEKTSLSKLMTQAEYDALPDTKLTDDVEYFITDTNPLISETIPYDGREVGSDLTNVQSALNEAIGRVFDSEEEFNIALEQGILKEGDTFRYPSQGSDSNLGSRVTRAEENIKALNNNINEINSDIDILNQDVDNIKNIIDRIYPVGSIYLSVSNVNPGTLIGGTWVRWGNGRVPVGVDTTQAEFNVAEKTGGAKTHTLTIAQMPSHEHPVYGKANNTKITVGFGGSGASIGNILGSDIGGDVVATSVGGGQAHNNLQPYITCFMWKRTE